MEGQTNEAHNRMNGGVRCGRWLTGRVLARNDQSNKIQIAPYNHSSAQSMHTSEKVFKTITDWWYCDGPNIAGARVR